MKSKLRTSFLMSLLLLLSFACHSDEPSTSDPFPIVLWSSNHGIVGSRATGSIDGHYVFDYNSVGKMEVNNPLGNAVIAITPQTGKYGIYVQAGLHDQAVAYFENDNPSIPSLFAGGASISNDFILSQETTPGFVKNDANGVLTGGHTIVATDVSAISDADGDTKIQVEESPDEDIIRFDAGIGGERMTISPTTITALGPMNIASLNVNNEIISSMGDVGIHLDSDANQIGYFQVTDDASNPLFIVNEAGLVGSEGDLAFVDNFYQGATIRISDQGEGFLNGLFVDNLKIDGNSLDATNDNGNVDITSRQAGYIRLGANNFGNIYFFRFAMSGPPGARVEIGDGGGTFDVNLYRSAANVLKTDDAFQAASFATGTTERISSAGAATFTTINGSGLATLGDLAVNTTDLTVDTSNRRVGVGTATPAGTLEVYQPNSWTTFYIKASAPDRVSSLRMYNNSTEYFIVDAWGTNQNSYTYFGQTSAGSVVIRTGPASGKAFALGTANDRDVILGTNNTENVRIKSGGQVGIGTSSPAARLEVETITTEATAVIKIDQNDIDQPFIYFEGQSSATPSNSISTQDPGGSYVGPKFNAGVPYGWVWEGMLRITVNGSTMWMPYYSWLEP